MLRVLQIKLKGIPFLNLNSSFFWHMASEGYKLDMQTTLSQCMTGGLGNVQMLHAGGLSLFFFFFLNDARLLDKKSQVQEC